MTPPGAGAQGSFAAVDLGASSGRVMRGVVGPNRLELHEVKRFRNGPVPLAGRLYWDALGLWQDIVEGLRDVGEIDSIGIDTWAVDYGLVDRSGLLLGNPRNYRDERTAGLVDRLDERIPRLDLYRRNGLQYQPFNTIYQLMSEAGDPLLDSAAHILLMPDLLGFWLTGRPVAEVTNASTTGLLDPITRTWARDLIDAIELSPALLPELIEPGQLIGSITTDAARAIGRAGTAGVVAVGSHDTASAIVGVPAATGDFAYIACGTWGLVGVELDHPILGPESQAANFTNELGVDGTVRYLKNVMGLWVLQQCHAEWRRGGDPTDIASIIALADARGAGGPVIDIDDTTLLAPGDMVHRVQNLCRNTDQPVPHTVGEIARCVIDSLAAAFARAVRQAADLSGQHIEVVHLVGGGAQNTLLCQLTADLTGIPVVAGPVEATALGNILIQARTHGAVSGGLAEIRALVRSTQRLVTFSPARQPR